jgi:hypothetical protein
MWGKRRQGKERFRNIALSTEVGRTVNAAEHDEQYITFEKAVAMAHSLIYSYRSYMDTSPHALRAPLVGQWLHSSPLKLNTNLVSQPSSFHDACHALIPLRPE